MPTTAIWKGGDGVLGTKTFPDRRQIKGFVDLEPGDQLFHLVAVRLDDLRCLCFGRMQQGDHRLIHPRRCLIRETAWLRDLLAKERVILAVAQIDRAYVRVHAPARHHRPRQQRGAADIVIGTGTENAIILATLSREMLKCRVASRWLMPSAQASRTFRYKSTVKILPPSLPPERVKVDDFYAARSRVIPPLPWTTFAPPFSGADVSRARDIKCFD